MHAEQVALAVGLALLLVPFLLVYFIYKFIQERRARRAIEAQLRGAPTTAKKPHKEEGATLPKVLPEERAPIPASPVKQYRFVALDVETANGNRDSICQIGLAFVTAGGTIETVSTLVNPRQKFTNTAIHNIAAHDVADAPLWPDVMWALAPAIERQPVIQHSGFDRSAVGAACTLHGMTAPNWEWFDSVQIARRAWPELVGAGGHGLASLKRHLSLEFDHQHAEEDARAAALVVLRAEKTTGLEFTSLLKATTKATSRTRGPLTDGERALLLALIAKLDAAPILAPAKARVLYDAHFREVMGRMTSGVSFGQASGSVLSDYWRQLDPKAAIRAAQDDLGEQVRIVSGLLDEWLTRGEAAAPFYAWRITVTLRKAKQFDLEREFLRAYCRHFSNQDTTRDGQLAERARKVGAI